MIGFILADLRRFSGGAFAVVALIALSVALCVTVALQERAVRLGSARAADKFDLVVGAAGSETQLMLSSVFLQPAPLPLVSGAVLGKLAADPRVAFAAPVGFGDSAFGFPVVGTTTTLITALSPELADGKVFARLGEAVVGADVNLSVGAEIKPMHGNAHTGGETHTEIIYRVSGRMMPTGTAWDRAVLVPIRAVWDLHGMTGEHGHEAGHDEGAHAESDHGHDEASHEPGVDGHDEAQHADAPQDHAAAEGGDDHHHHGAVDGDEPIDEAFDASSPGIPAVLVKPKTIADAYRLRQEYRSETTLAVFPGEVLTSLYGTLGDARSLLLAIAIGTQAIVIAAIVMVTVMHVGSRQRQIGALRALGIPRRSVIAIVWGELFALFLLGAALGAVIGYGAAMLISSTLAATTAVRMPVEFAREDIPLVIGFLLTAALVSIAPALAALRLSPARALRA